MRRVLFSVVIAFVVLGSIEALSRVAVAIFEKEPPVPRYIKQFDPRLGWSLRPGMREWSSRTGYPILYAINSNGLRDAEIPYAKPAGEFRIVLVGDSHTFGYGVPIAKHYSTLLEGYFSRVEVVNAGVGGYGVDQDLLMLQYEGLRYEPDLVLAYVPHYGRQRHMHAWRYGRDKPLFELVDGVLRLTHSPVPDPHVGWAGVAAWLRRYSKAWDFIGGRFERLLVRLGAVEPEEDWRARDADDWEDERFVERMNALGSRIVLEMDAVARRNGARFALITKARRTLDLYADTVAAGIPALDVSRPLDNRRFRLPARFRHMNESGNGVLAWEIAEFLKAQGLVPRAHW